MTDLEMTRLCAEAMGYQRVAISNVLLPGFHASPPFVSCSYTGTSIDTLYDPLHDDAQAMQLVKRFRLELTCGLHDIWIASNRGTVDYVSGNNADLNRAIVECVAKMQKASTKSAHPSPENTDSV